MFNRHNESYIIANLLNNKEKNIILKIILHNTFKEIDND